MSATAGEMGPTSRGTVSISITIPPHIVVQPTGAATAEAAGSANGLCISTNGFREFHLAFLADGTSQVTAPAEQLATDQADRQAFCRSSEVQGRALPEIVAGQLIAQAPGSGTKPLTLLIVPE